MGRTDRIVRPTNEANMFTTCFHVLLAATAIQSGQQSAPRMELVEPVRKIWDQGGHNAFTDLVRFRERWYCVFREGKGHASGAGVIRVLTSADGKAWQSAAVVEKTDVDLRDPHLSITPDGRLMLVGGAAVPPTRDPVKDHYSWASF